MIICSPRFRRSKIYRVISSFVIFSFIFSPIVPPGYAQVTPQSILGLPVPGSMVAPSNVFTPPLVKGITIHPEDPLLFDFIVYPGDNKLSGTALQQESTKLIKYFLASLTVPEDDLWVNLSPHEKDRIIPESFGVTEMGRDLLAQDYILKQLSASLMYPEKDLGNSFWKRVNTKVQARFGNVDIPMNTFNKVWIIPENATVYEHNGSAFVINSYLKVMLEEDYLTMKKAGPKAQQNDTIKEMTSVIREILIPEIEKEVNEGQNFANLRQIYNSMILAVWYKKSLKESLLGQVYANQNKIKGVDVEDKQVKQKIYDQYLEAFKKGVYNYIKEEYDPSTQQMIAKKYFSGGARGPAEVRTVSDSAMLSREVRNESEILTSGAVRMTARFFEIGKNGDPAKAIVPTPDAAMLTQVSAKDLNVPIKFGTSGWRARMDTEEFTIDNVGRVAKAIAQELKAQVETGEYTPNDPTEGLKILVAFDGRKGSKEFAQRAIEVLAAYGIKTAIGNKLATTPVVIAQTRESLGKDAYDLAIHLTASHNDARYNGVKILQRGVVAPDSLTVKFAERANKGEKESYEREDFDSLSVPAIDITRRALNRYEQLLPGIVSTVSAYRAANPDVQFFVDVMHGSAGPFVKLFEDMGATIVRKVPMRDGDYPKGTFLEEGQEKPYRPEPQRRFLSQADFDNFEQNAPNGSIYMAIDGDGDRLAAWVKSEGKVFELTPNELGVLYGWYFIANGQADDFPVIAKTLPTTYAMNKLAEWAKKKMVVTPVGSKYFGPNMVDTSQEKAIVASEESGHHGVRGVFDDAAYQGMLLLQILASTGKSIPQLVKDVHAEIGFKGVYKRVNRDASEALKKSITSPLSQDPQAFAKKIEAAVGKKAKAVSVTATTEQVVSLAQLIKDGLKLNVNEGIHLQFEDNSWAQVRLSGTEPVVRIYTEATTEEQRQVLENAVAAAIGLAGAQTGKSALQENILPELARLAAPRQDEIQRLVYQYRRAVEQGNKDQAVALEGNINKILDEMNAFRGSAVSDMDVLKDEVLSLDNFLTTPEAGVFVDRAKQTLLSGDYVPQFVFAGAATRLNRGAMYPLDIWDIIKEKGDLKEGDGKIKLGMGPRQIIAYRMAIERLAEERGLSPEWIMRDQRIVINTNQEVHDLVLEDFRKNNFYGFNPDNVFFVMQPALKGYNLKANGVSFDPDSKSLPYGHGYNFMQLMERGSAVRMTESGKIVPIDMDVLSLLGDDVFVGSHRINDLTKFLSGEVIDINKLAFGMYLHEQGHNLVAELVENPQKQKGGNAVKDRTTGKSFLLETSNVKGNAQLTTLINEAGQLGAPYNAFRLLYRVGSLRQLLQKDLPYNLRFKNGALYLEAVTGDVTQMEKANAVFFKQNGTLIHDFKEDKNLPDAAEHLRKQDAELIQTGMAVAADAAMMAEVYENEFISAITQGKFEESARFKFAHFFRGIAYSWTGDEAKGILIKVEEGRLYDKNGVKISPKAAVSDFKVTSILYGVNYGDGSSNYVVFDEAPKARTEADGSSSVVDQGRARRASYDEEAQRDSGWFGAQMGGLGGDSAMLSETPVGGIDFNPELLDLQIRRDGKGIPLPLPQQSIQNMKIDGFLPVIINVTPVNNLPLLMGTKEPSPKKEDVLAQAAS